MLSDHEASTVVTRVSAPDSAVCPPHYSFTCSPRAPPPAGRRVGGKRASACASWRVAAWKPPPGAAWPRGLRPVARARPRASRAPPRRRAAGGSASATTRCEARAEYKLPSKGGGNSQQNKTQQQASTRPSALGGGVLWKERRATISGSLLRPVRSSTPKALQSFTPRPKRPWANAF